jgi:hypothetical protein
VAFFDMKARTAILVSAAAILTIGATLPVIQRHYATSALSSTRKLSGNEEKQYLDATSLTPKQAAQTFFEACSRQDWNEVRKSLPARLPSKDPLFFDHFKEIYGGAEIISLGQPFKGTVVPVGHQPYPGVYVPYEIRLKNGSIRQCQLAIRCDNPDKRWICDGA